MSAKASKAAIFGPDALASCVQPATSRILTKRRGATKGFSDCSANSLKRAPSWVQATTNESDPSSAFKKEPTSCLHKER